MNRAPCRGAAGDLVDIHRIGRCGVSKTGWAPVRIPVGRAGKRIADLGETSIARVFAEIGRLATKIAPRFVLASD